MTTYVIDFQSGGDEGLPGKGSISLPRNTVNTTSTSLALTGLGTSLYGEMQQENFIKLLENFASATAPANPTIGQFWFDTSANKPKIFDTTGAWVEFGSGSVISQTTPPDTTVVGQPWFNPTEQILYTKIASTGLFADLYPQYYDGTWAQLWPHPIPYASIAEFNTLATRVNRIIGTPTIDGDGAWGWGQTDTIPVFSSVNNPTPFDNSTWLTLLSRVKKAARHVDQTTAKVIEAAVPTSGFVLDGRGPNASAIQYSPNTTWANDWAGFGIMSQGDKWSALVSAITAIETNRFEINPLDTTWTTVDMTSRPSWASTKVYVATVQFTTENQARRFFNAGGALRFNVFGTDISTSSVGAEWNNLFTANATGVNDFATQGVVLDWQGTRQGPAGTYTGAGLSIGYYELTSTYTTLRLETRGGAYGTGSLLFEGKTSTVGGWTVDIRITFTEDFDVGQVIPGTTSVVLQTRTPTGSFGGEPTINSPMIAAPSVITSGTFKTTPAE